MKNKVSLKLRGCLAIILILVGCFGVYRFLVSALSTFEFVTVMIGLVVYLFFLSSPGAALLRRYPLVQWIPLMVMVSSYFPDWLRQFPADPLLVSLTMIAFLAAWLGTTPVVRWFHGRYFVFLFTLLVIIVVMLCIEHITDRKFAGFSWQTIIDIIIVLGITTLILGVLPLVLKKVTHAERQGDGIAMGIGRIHPPPDVHFNEETLKKQIRFLGIIIRVYRQGKWSQITISNE
jgi:hypothetical protein